MLSLFGKWTSWAKIFQLFTLCRKSPPNWWDESTTVFIRHADLGLFLLLFGRSVLSNCLRPHGLQHTKLAYSLLSPRVCSDSHPLSQWCYLTISSSASPFSFWLHSFPTSGSFLMSWLFTSGGQNIRASASITVLPMNIQGLFLWRLTRLIFLQSRGLSRVFSYTTVWRHQFFSTQPSFWSSSSHVYMTPGKTIALTIWIFVSKMMSLLFNMLSRFVIAFLTRSKHLLISWLQ